MKESFAKRYYWTIVGAFVIFVVTVVLAQLRKYDLQVALWTLIACFGIAGAVIGIGITCARVIEYFRKK